MISKMLKIGPSKHEQIRHLKIYIFSIKYSLSKSQKLSDFVTGWLRLTNSLFSSLSVWGYCWLRFSFIHYKVTEYIFKLKKCGNRSLHQLSVFKILIPVFHFQ